MTLGPLHQIALSCGSDLEAAVAFYRDVLGLPLLGRFEPPGIAFFDADGVRLLLSPEAPKAQIYLRVANLPETSRALAGRGAAFKGEPVMVHRDDAGQFGAAGEEEWMQFFEDPAGNLIAIAERRAPRS